METSQDHFAGEEVGEQVGHEEQAIGGGEEGALLLRECEHVIKRVDGHELDAGGIEDGLAADEFDRFLEHAIGAAVAVVDGEPQKLAAGEEAKIDAPGVNGDSVELEGTLGFADAGGFAQGRF